MSVEFRIRKLLNERKKLRHIADELLNLAASPDCSQQEIHEITQFLIRSGMYKEAFQQFPRRFYEQKLIPWSQFIELLVRLEIHPSKNILDALFEGAKKTKKENLLILQRAWDHHDIRFKEMRRALWESKLDELESLRNSLRQKIEFLQNQRMIHEEKKVFKKYLEMFPEDKTILPLYNNFKERWADEVVEQKRGRQTSTAMVEEEIELPRLSAEEFELSEVIYEYIEDLLAANNKNALNFSLMFLNFELPEFALEIAQNASNSTLSVEWLIAELLYENKKYSQCVQHLDLIEKKFAADPEIKFGVAYLKAKTLIEQKQKTRAIEILNNIVQLRPNYRSASSLLAELIEDRK